MMRRLFARFIVLSLLFAGASSPLPARADGDPCSNVDAPGCTNGLPAAEYQRLLAEMQAYPTPAVTPIPIDKKEVGAYSFYKVQPDTKTYDAPNGNVVGQIDNGFNYVSVYKV